MVCVSRGPNNTVQWLPRLTERDAGHEEELSAVAEEHRQQHALARRAEDVTVHQLPAELLLRLLLQAQASAVDVQLLGVGIKSTPGMCNGWATCTRVILLSATWARFSNNLVTINQRRPGSRPCSAQKLLCALATSNTVDFRFWHKITGMIFSLWRRRRCTVNRKLRVDQRAITDAYI